MANASNHSPELMNLTVLHPEASDKGLSDWDLLALACIQSANLSIRITVHAGGYHHKLGLCAQVQQPKSKHFSM
jgi:hypothetical protein